MDMKIPEWVKPGAWGVVIGAAVFATAAFTSEWAVTSSTAKQMASQQANEAVIASLTPICIAQFRDGGQMQVHVAALEGEKSWERGAYVAGKGWATMPGSESPNDNVARECAEQLMKMTGQ
jgi:hypothetical protein